MKRNTVFSMITIVIGLLIPVIIFEVVFGFLPVSNFPMNLPVNESNQIARYKENQEYTWSKDWDFSIVTRKRTNNYGFVNDHDYKKSKMRMMALIGDSAIEAQQVPNNNAVSGLVSDKVKDRGRVYSFAMSGAPLSQYLAFAKYAHDEFGADSMVFSVVANDFDESLAEYKLSPRFHYFFRGEDGALLLKRTDYKLSALKRVLRKSAFIRYLVYNLEAGATINSLLHPADENTEYVGNVNASYSESRINDAQEAVREFFRLLTVMSGLDRNRILFVVGGAGSSLYSEETLIEAKESYAYVMRDYFIATARQLGYEVKDLLPVFLNRHREDGSRFDFPTDGHWNQLGHELVSKEIIDSNVFRNTFRESAD